MEKKIDKEIFKDCSFLNFPIKSFYSAKHKECYTFYRQGYCISVDPHQPEVLPNRIEQITTNDLGSMYLLFEEALVARSSGNILFF